MKSINAQEFKSMIICAANNLYNNHKYVDSLNVFPVPDGDTGTNMNMTMTSGIREIAELNTNNASEIAKAFSKGLLMGARGNSGVILSQIFKGMAKEMDHSHDIDVKMLRSAFKGAKEAAYKAVVNPMEGTILTVIKDVTDALDEYLKKRSNCSIELVLGFAVEEAKKSLETTPELLPILKEAGVVDSGGAGLVYILEGLYAGAKGERIERQIIDEDAADGKAAKAVSSEEGYGFCTEFIARLNDPLNFDEDGVRENLMGRGNSIVFVRDEELLKVHIHTLTPGDILNFAQQYGELIKIKVENMQEQHNHLIATEAKRKKYALITVAAGNGMEKIFRSLRADFVVKGGNTMNPSTSDFLEAITFVNADTVFIMPNNSNIILAAKQAATVCKSSKVIVIETKTIPQGVLACTMFNPEEDVDTNTMEMNSAKDSVKTGQLTFAVRDSNSDGFKIEKGDYIGTTGKKIVACAKDRIEAAKQMLDNMIDNDSSLLTVYVGEGANEEETQKIVDYVNDNHLMMDVEVKQADQPVYYYIFAVE